MDDEDRMAVLGRRVRSRRVQLGMSQADVAATGDLGEATVRRIEKGELTTLRMRTRAALEEALQLRSGAVERVLDGSDSAEDWTDVVKRSIDSTPSAAGGGDGPLVVEVTKILGRLANEAKRTADVEDAMESLRRILPELWRGEDDPIKPSS